MPHADGSKSGGRRAGTPNKGTKALRSFLERVFARVFVETIEVGDGKGGLRQRSYEDHLVEQILAGTLDEKYLATLLAYYAGKPSQAIDVTTRDLTLEEIIAGVRRDEAVEVDPEPEPGA